MAQGADKFQVAGALVAAFGGRAAAYRALTRAGFGAATVRHWLSGGGRAISLGLLERLLALVPDPVAFLTDLGFAADQPWLRALWRGTALARAETAAETARVAKLGLPHTLETRLRALLPGREAEYWVSEYGPELVEEGLDAAAARHLHEPEPVPEIDYSHLLRLSLGYISVVRRAGSPTLIQWQSGAVEPEALAQLLHALPVWDRGDGWRFINQVSDSTLVVPTVSGACFEVERALGIARASNGQILSPHLAAEALGFERADATGAAILAAWRAHRNNPADFAAALPRDAEGFVCLYRLGDRGMVTDYHGTGLPPILGVPWDQLDGVATVLEPAHPDYRGLYMSHLLETATSGRPSYYSIRGSVGALSGGYRRLAVPFKQNADVCGILTYTSDIGGVECLRRLAC